MGLMQCLENKVIDQKTEKVFFTKQINDNSKIINSLTLRLPKNQLDISFDKNTE